MVSKIVRYKIKPEETDTVLAAIKEFLMAIANSEPETRYDALQLVDGVSFIHTMRFPSSLAEEQHQKAQYTLKFVDVLYPRCEIAPEFTEVKEYFSSKP
jgi:hypothetical protein